MKTTVGVLGGLGALALLLVLGLATSWFGLVVDRPMQKYQEETRKEVYDTSRQYQQGTNRDVARYCEQMREAQGSSKKAVAALIRSVTSTYDGPLSQDNEDCLTEAKGY